MDRISAQDLARLYAPTIDVSRATPTPAIAVQPVGSAHRLPCIHSRDSVRLSDSARSMSLTRTAMQNSPGARQQELADIKQQLSNGTYQVTSGVLARNMLDSSNTPVAHRVR